MTRVRAVASEAPLVRQRPARPARPQLREGRSPPPGSGPTGSTGWPAAAGRPRRASGDTEPLEPSELTGARSGSDHRPAGKGLYAARPVSGGTCCRHTCLHGQRRFAIGQAIRRPASAWPIRSHVVACPPHSRTSHLVTTEVTPDPRRRRRGSAPCTACWTAARPCGWRAMRSMAKSALSRMRGGEAVGVHDVEDVSGAARPQGTGHRMDVAGDPPAWARLGTPSRAGLPTRAPPRFRPGRCRSGRPRRVWRDVRRPSRSPPASCRHRRPPSGPSRWCRVRRH